MTENEITILDTALLEANADSDKRSSYYNVFLSSEIFVPTHDIPKEEFQGPAGGDSCFRPIIMESSGDKYLMLFDTKEKLANWAKQEIGFVAFQGRALFKIFRDSNMFWSLNHGTNYAKSFSPEEIHHIRKSLSQNTLEEVKIEKGTSMGIGELTQVPEGIKEALLQIGKMNMDIFEIYLGSVIFEDEGKPHFAVVVKVEDDGFVNVEEMRQSIVMSIKNFLGKDGYINIFFDEGKEDGVAIAIKNKSRLIYKK